MDCGWINPQLSPSHCRCCADQKAKLICAVVTRSVNFELLHAAVIIVAAIIGRRTNQLVGVRQYGRVFIEKRVRRWRTHTDDVHSRCWEGASLSSVQAWNRESVERTVCACAYVKREKRISGGCERVQHRAKWDDDDDVAREDETKKMEEEVNL